MLYAPALVRVVKAVFMPNCAGEGSGVFHTHVQATRSRPIRDAGILRQTPGSAQVNSAIHPYRTFTDEDYNDVVKSFDETRDCWKEPFVIETQRPEAEDIGDVRAGVKKKQKSS